LLLHEKVPAGLSVEAEAELEPAATALFEQDLGSRIPVEQVN